MIRIIKIILFGLLAHNTCAQYKDAGLWTEGSLALEYGKRWEFNLTPELRFNENISNLSRAFTDLGAQYKINKFLQAGLVYRIGIADNDGFYDMRQRIQLGLGLKMKWNKWSLNYAPRWQLSLAPSTSYDADIATTMRNRIQLKFGGFKKYDVGTSFEFFHSTSTSTFFEWQNWRWINQVSYELNKRRSISVGYMLQRKLVSSPQQMDYVVLAGYKYTWNLKGTKEKELKKPS